MIDYNRNEDGNRRMKILSNGTQATNISTLIDTSMCTIKIHVLHSLTSL